MPRSAAARKSAWSGDEAVADHRHAGGVGCSRLSQAISPPPHAPPARRRVTPARGGSSAPGGHWIRAARTGGNGGRVFGPRRNSRRLPAGSAKTGAHRPLRRSGRVHPALRRRVAAVCPEGRGLRSTTVDGVSKSRPFWRLHDLCGRPTSRARSSASRDFPGWELVAPMLRPRNASVFR